MSADIEAMEARSRAEIDNYHKVQAEFANRLATKYATKAIEALKAATEVIKAAGFAIEFGLWNRIEYRSGGIPVLKSSLQPALWGEYTVEHELDEADRAVLVEVKKAADVHWKEHDRLDEELRKAYREALEAHEPLDFDGLLALVKEDHEDQEEYYTNHAPRKNEQEGCTGVQVVSMNVDLFIAWLDTAGDDYESLPVEQQRKIWEASAFHFGIMGYDADDADHFWDVETTREEEEDEE